MMQTVSSKINKVDLDKGKPLIEMWPFCKSQNEEILIVYHHGETFKTFSHSDCWMYDNEIDVNIKYETIVYNTVTS